MPALEECQVCRRTLKAARKWFWQPAQGKLVCEDHFYPDDDYIALDSGTLSLIRYMRKLPIEKTWRLRMRQEMKAPLLKGLLDWFRYHTRKEIQSIKVLEQILPSFGICSSIVGSGAGRRQGFPDPTRLPHDCAIWYFSTGKEATFMLTISHFADIAHNSPWLALLLSFLGGVLASFTPCTYPMMPITVAFIGGKANGSRRRGFLLSLFYVLGLAIVYSTLAIFAALTGQMFGALTANPWVYLVVANILLFFGLVMLEAVPLAPPGFLNNLKVTGFTGHDVFTSMLLGGASALVVSTCTTPILA